jgi:hypothetical protein
MKEPAKNWAFFGWFFDLFNIFLENCSYIPKWSFELELVGKWIYMWVDNWSVSVHDSKNSPTLEQTPK